MRKKGKATVQGIRSTDSMRSSMLLVCLTLGDEGETVHQNSQPAQWSRSSIVQDPSGLMDITKKANAFQNNNFHKVFNRGKIAAADDRYSKLAEPHDDYDSSYSVNLVGPSHLERIQSEHYQKKVPQFDVSDFQEDHHAQEKHAEVHYHQHKHIHKHEHKQDHVHQHKNQHEHKHKHQSAYNHQHKHKHGHHQNHKHGYGQGQQQQHQFSGKHRHQHGHGH